MPSSGAEGRLSHLLRRLGEQKSLPHAVVAVRSGDRSFDWSGAIGAADISGTPMRPGTPYFLASIDKLYNATILLRLHERGEVRLDEPITAYLPTSLVRGLHRLDGVDRTDEITVRHLLGHMSGLADWLEDHPKGGHSLVEQLFFEGDRAMSLEEILHYVRNHLIPHFPPQSPAARRPKVRYCDTNFILLAAIIEAVAGQPLHRVHDSMIYQPLNLQQTWMAGHSRPLDPTAAPAMLWVGDRPLEMPLMMRSFWGMYSTARDALTFLEALAKNRIFERSTTFGLMQAWHRFGLPLDRAAMRSPRWPIEYGLGVMRFYVPRAIALFGRVPPLIGHTGSTGCWLFHCPERDLFFAGTVDQATAGALPFRFVPKLLRALDEC